MRPFARFFRRDRLAILAGATILSLAACRQILGLEGNPPLVSGAGVGGEGAGGAGGAAGAGANGATGGADAGSPFTILHAVPQGAVLNSVWGANPHFVVAVGTDKTSFFIQDDVITKLGGTELGSDYFSVWGFGPSDIYAVGQGGTNGGFVEHYDGKGWTGVYETPTPLFSVWGTKNGSQQVVFASGAKGEIHGWHTGISWGKLSSFPKGAFDPKTSDSPRFWSISGRNIDDWAFASDGRLWHNEQDAGGFAWYELNQKTNTRFRSIWQVPGPETSIYIGTNFYGLAWFSAKGTEQTGYPLTLLFRDEATPGGDKAYIQGVWATAQKVVGVGDNGRIYAFDVGTQLGAVVPSPSDDSFAGVWGSALDDIYIVGNRELILHGSLK